MKIDGKQIAQQILDDLKLRVRKLKKKNIIPHLHIITLTTDSASEAYVGQKRKKGEEIGVQITVENLDPNTPEDILLEKIEKLNLDPNVHGIIIQRPFSSHVDEEEIARSIKPSKDVDGFHPNSKFSPPITEAVLKILEKINPNPNLINWLKTKKVAVIGKGVTAGSQIIKVLKRERIEPEVISSQTKNKEDILKNSDIIITSVGKSGIIKGSGLKKGVILIGVGMFRGEDGKFHSDYEEAEIKNIASFYTPTPGGVGPINVAMLFSNLVKATV